MDRSGKSAGVEVAESSRGGSGRREIDRLVEKGKAKDAFKQAKLYFHREASAENRKLVEYTYICRVQELIRGGMISAAREVAASALEFGVTDTELLKQLASKLPLVGMMDKALQLRNRFGSAEEANDFSATLADQAVVHPAGLKDSAPEIHAAAAPILAAFSALDAGNEAQALESLRSIPRGSPMADWRYFIRGLIAFRKRDVERARSDWDRLEPRRASRKIAQKLLATVEVKPEEKRSDGLKRIEVLAFGEPVLDRIAELRTAANAKDWKRVFKMIPSIQKCLKKTDPRLAERVAELVMSSLFSEIINASFQDSKRLFEGLKSSLEPLAWDPNWNRFLALMWEGPYGDEDFAVVLWRNYLQDLAHAPAAFPGVDTKRVQALVWSRIGQILFDKAIEREEEDDIFGIGARLVGPKWTDDLDRAVEAFKQSSTLDPARKKPYDKLVDIYLHFNKNDQAIEALEDSLKHFPDDVESLKQLIRLYRRADDYEGMLRCVLRYRELKPLDSENNLNLAWARLSLARRLTAKKNREAGRAEFDLVEKMTDNPIPSYVVTGSRAVFELKSGDDERARELAARAETEAKHRASAFLVIAIEAVRYGLSVPLRDRYIKEFKAALSSRPTSESAGELADLVNLYVKYDVSFTGCRDRFDEVASHLRKATNLKFKEHDLRKVCEFFAFGVDDTKLEMKFAKLGRKLFPGSLYYLIREITAQLDDESSKLDPRRTRRKLEKALEKSRNSAEPQNPEWISEVKDLINQMKDLENESFPFPFFGGGPKQFSGPGKKMFEEFFKQMQFKFDEDYDDDFFDDDDDDDDDDDKPPRRRPKRPSKRKPK
jgi:tetratricopeptide (TPR) repeat protein